MVSSGCCQSKFIQNPALLEPGQTLIASCAAVCLRLAAVLPGLAGQHVFLISVLVCIYVVEGLMCS
jgi:hypothetical protein